MNDLAHEIRSRQAAGEPDKTIITTTCRRVAELNGLYEQVRRDSLLALKCGNLDFAWVLNARAKSLEVEVEAVNSVFEQLRDSHE